MRTYAALSVMLCLTVPGLAATTRTGHPTTSNKSHSGTTAKKTTTTHRVTASKKTSRTSKSARSRYKRQSWRTGQMAPTPERYQEIQQALINKGYLQPPATGVWGADSSDAVKKFQQDQSLEPSGKLDSLTLISLGLGPKRDSSSPTAVLNPPVASGGGGRDLQ